VVAEGVESVAHGRSLIELGCELAQGYAIARPMPADRLTDWCSAWKPPVEWTAARLQSTPLAV
jgi:EAL domain-containing protein (putative c-di-GMP-specific phosphodiesterase class I)